MQSVEIRGLDETVKKLEGFPDAVKAAKAAFFEETGEVMLAAVQRRIGGTGRVAGVQERYIGSGKGYAAVRAKARTELSGYAAGYITNALEGGHLTKGGKSRVLGKYMYQMTAASELVKLQEDGAREIEKKAAAYLEGEG